MFLLFCLTLDYIPKEYTPKFLCLKPVESSFYLTFYAPNSIQLSSLVSFPFHFEGVFFFLNTSEISALNLWVKIYSREVWPLFWFPLTHHLCPLIAIVHTSIFDISKKENTKIAAHDKSNFSFICWSK